MQKYDCANCGREFTERERLCEDYRVVEKSLICPHCKFYLKQKSESAPFEKTASNLVLFNGILFFLLFIIANTSEYQELVYKIILIPLIIVMVCGVYTRGISAKRAFKNIPTIALSKSNM